MRFDSSIAARVLSQPRPFFDLSWIEAPLPQSILIGTRDASREAANSASAIRSQ